MRSGLYRPEKERTLRVGDGQSEACSAVRRRSQEGAHVSTGGSLRRFARGTKETATSTTNCPTCRSRAGTSKAKPELTHARSDLGHTRHPSAAWCDGANDRIYWARHTSHTHHTNLMFVQFTKTSPAIPPAGETNALVASAHCRKWQIAMTGVAGVPPPAFPGLFAYTYDADGMPRLKYDPALLTTAGEMWRRSEIGDQRLRKKIECLCGH